MNKIEKISKRIYIEINSNYRNRNQYPNPAQFDVNVGNTGQKITGASALDPICLAQPIRSFNTGVLAGESGTMTGTPSAPILSAVTTTQSLVGGMIQNDARSEQTIVTAYNSFTRQVQVTPPFSVDWVDGDAFSFINLSTNTNIFFTGGPTAPVDKYVGQLLYNTTIDEYRTITSYKDNILTVDSAFGGGWSNNDNYQIQSNRHIITNIAGGLSSIISGAITTTTITLNAADSAVDDFYNGRFIRLIENTNRPPDGPEVTALITDYVGATRVATVVIMDLSAFNVATTLRYYIFPFSRDNYSYLNYVGFEANERSLYRISLNSLVLPNRLLNNPKGGRIVFYPYVYVVFSNKALGVSSLINSNNPNSHKAVFRVPINDTPDPELASFLKLEARMVNTFEFNPFEDLTFEVYLPDGSLFTTTLQDTTPPELPEPLVQISCNIALERV